MNWILGVLFAGGLLIAGSDSLWFPWANIGGIMMFGMFGVLAKYKERMTRGKGNRVRH